MVNNVVGRECQGDREDDNTAGHQHNGHRPRRLSKEEVAMSTRRNM